MGDFSGARFTVGEWTVEPNLNRITRDGCEVHLEPRVMDLLVYLSDCAGQLASRTEIIDMLWAEKYVADTVLTRAVSLLRTALGDNPRSPRYVETIAKRGYRLIAPVTPEAVPNDRERNPIVTVGGRQWLLTADETIIGRGPSATVRIDHPRVSRRHARIRFVRGQAELDDLGSKNGTLLNGVPVVSATSLRSGDHIVVGSQVAVYLEPWLGSTLSESGSSAALPGDGLHGGSGSHEIPKGGPAN